MKYHPKVYKIISRIAKENGLTYDVVHDIVVSQFELLKQGMGEGDYDDEESFKNVSLMHLGKFVAKPARIKYINKCKEHGRKNKGNS